MIPAMYAQWSPSQERRLRRGGDLRRVLRILLRDGLARSANDFVSSLCDAVGDLRAVRRGRDRRGDRRRVARGEQRAEDRLHDRAAEVALQVGGARGHAGPLHRHRAGQRVRGRRAREPDADADERVAEPDLPVRVPSFHSSSIVRKPSRQNT